MTQTEQVVSSLSNFNIEKRPEGLFIKSGKYDKLLTALKNLASDKVITFLPSDLQEQFGQPNVNNFKAAMTASAKRFKIKVAVVQKDGLIYVFTRS